MNVKSTAKEKFISNEIKKKRTKKFQAKGRREEKERRGVVAPFFVFFFSISWRLEQKSWESFLLERRLFGIVLPVCSVFETPVVCCFVCYSFFLLLLLSSPFDCCFVSPLFKLLLLVVLLSSVSLTCTGLETCDVCTELHSELIKRNTF